MGQIDTRTTGGQPPVAERAAVQSVESRTTENSTSGGVLAALKAPSSTLGNIFLGEKLADGIVARFSVGGPNIHVLNTDVRATLQSLKDHASKLPTCIEKYRILQGFTPSKEAFKVCELILRRQMGGDRGAIAELKRISDEATQIDLKRPQGAAWKREMSCSLGGVATRLTISLSPVSVFDRVVSKLVSTDLSKESVGNRYGYQVTLRPEAEARRVSLAPVRRLFRQVAEVSVMIAPMAVTMSAISQSTLVETASKLTQNSLAQGFLVDVMRLSSYAVIGAITFLVTERLQRARLCRTEKPESPK
ncbi:MAG: hypothetical protein RL326_912 [Pseudomonadota bacterium]|jgi:hypothetical protein